MRRFLIALLACGLGMMVAAAVGCNSIRGPKLLEDLDPLQNRGQQVFQEKCVACHYDRRSGDKHGPSLLAIFRKPYLPSGAPANDERVTATILHGRNMMPAMGNNMSDKDLTALLAYLHTL